MARRHPRPWPPATLRRRRLREWRQLRCQQRLRTSTTSLLERLFLEERRRLKVLPHAAGERPILKLMFPAMTRAGERWRAFRITDFERRQMAAVRDDLDAEYHQHVGLADAPTA